MSLKSALIGCFWIFAVAYVGVMHLAPFPGHWLVKAVPALSLAGLVWVRLGGRLRVLLAAALALSAAGDVALSIRSDGEQTYFVVGLAFFLAAHLCYVAAFALERRYVPARLPVLVAVAGLAVAMAALLIPHLGGLLAPVLFYVAAITAMGVMAVLNARGGVLLIVGAALFFISDATIAVNTFLLPEPHPAASYLIMPTYYAAQFCIAFAFVRSGLSPARRRGGPP